MEGLRNAIYQDWTKDIQEKGYLDWLVYTECRSDNAYGGNPGTGELMAIEANRQDGENKNVERDWDWYLGQVSKCNNIIFNIDRIKEADESMTEKEWKEWKSEAYCWRAWNLFQMSQIWGDIPLVNSIPPAISADNIEDVYKDYYPPRTARVEVYKQIVGELEFAAENAPETDPSNKHLFTKAFAHGMLARIFAEETLRNWEQVAKHCEAIEKMNYELVDDYAQMWAYDETDAVRNTSESIFEVTFTRSSGNWVWMMCGFIISSRVKPAGRVPRFSISTRSSYIAMLTKPDGESYNLCARAFRRHSLKALYGIVRDSTRSGCPSTNVPDIFRCLKRNAIPSS